MDQVFATNSSNEMKLIDKKYIEYLAMLIGESDLSEISIEQESVKLTLKRERKTTADQTTTPMLGSVLESNPREEDLPSVGSGRQDETVAEENLHHVTTPLVGTFYNAPAPDAPPYVQKGDKVAKGQTLCIVEAMKLMNEIESDVDGVVEEILCENASPVEFGSKLFAIRMP